ncbi:YybH family protein [Spirosoma flavum]|uniref:YybH family protein n=1 Tax=Spirosoma flavum TaxID=2048557 RepID=A0ABW6AGC0_9BACT
MKKFLRAHLLSVAVAILIPLFTLAQIIPTPKAVKAADEVVIRALRIESNQAIQGRDLTGFGKTMMPDIEVTRGSGSHISGRDSVLASVRVQFKDAAFLGYVRHADSVQISTSSPLAAENGHWTGRFQRPDGIQTITGVYLAMWRKTEAGWKIRSELFVSLSCTGSAACGK